MAGRRADILVKMLDYESYISVSQLRNDLGVSNSSNNEDYILFRQTIKDLIKDGLLDYDDDTRKTQEAYKPEYRDQVIDNMFGGWKIRLTSAGRRELREESSIQNHAKNENKSSIKIGRARDVHIDQSQKIEQDARIIEYKGEKADNEFVEFLCETVLERFGAKKTIAGGGISLLLGLAGFFSSINSFFPTIKPIQYLPQFPSQISSPISIVSVLLMFAGAILLGLYEYKLSSKCSKCGEFYALKEYKSPTVKEIKIKGGTKINGVRYLKCSKCGNEQTREYTDFIEDEEKEE